MKKQAVEYLFTGRVLPERAAVSISAVQFGVEIKDAALSFTTDVSIDASQVSVLLKTEKVGTDLETLRNYVEYIVRAEVDAFGYLEGRAYDVEITAATMTSAESPKPVVFGVEIRELHEHKTERPASFDELFKVLFSGDPRSNSLRRALGDLREAIRSRHDTGFFCYRAIESLMQGFREDRDGDDKKPAWERLRNDLRVDRSWITALKRFGDPQRHGATPYMSGTERVQAMQYAWKVVDRFVVFALRGFQPLPEADFQVLK